MGSSDWFRDDDEVLDGIQPLLSSFDVDTNQSV